MESSSFSYERMGTKTRFEKGTKGNLEMAYLVATFHPILHDKTFRHGYNITDYYRDFISFGNHPAIKVHFPFIYKALKRLLYLFF